MKQTYSVLIFLMLILASCNSQTDKTEVATLANTSDIEVYYFHLTTRCVTCTAVEAEARKNIELLYADRINDGTMSFIALNLEEATGKAMADRLGVSGQTLLIVKGEQKINITNEGFLYAISKPEKFAEVIKERIDPLLE